MDCDKLKIYRMINSVNDYTYLNPFWIYLFKLKEFEYEKEYYIINNIPEFINNYLDGLTTEKAEILRGVALALEKEMGPILPTPKRKEQESQATAAQLMEFYRIVTQPRGLSQEPLYVQQGGMYRRIRVEDRRYRKLIALPAAERFVKMEP